MDNKSKAKGDDFVAVDSDQTSVEQFNELVLITDECHNAALVCDQPADEVPALVQDEIQSSLADVSTSGSLVFPIIVDTVYVQPVDEDTVSIQEEVQSILKEIPIILLQHDSEMIDHY